MDRFLCSVITTTIAKHQHQNHQQHHHQQHRRHHNYYDKNSRIMPENIIIKKISIVDDYKMNTLLFNNFYVYFVY
jgi:hypothetical protein